MARAILADVNVEGQVRVLIRILESVTWRDLWQSLNLPLWNFRTLGLTGTVSDAALWHTCQGLQIALVTANRNATGPDSLEATIRAHNKVDSLPVFTLADAQRVLHSRDYAERTAAKLLDYLLNIDQVLGTGRLYIP
jgi:hypothetical protein